MSYSTHCMVSFLSFLRANNSNFFPDIRLVLAFFPFVNWYLPEEAIVLYHEMKLTEVVEFKEVVRPLEEAFQEIKRSRGDVLPQAPPKNLRDMSANWRQIFEAIRLASKLKKMESDGVRQCVERLNDNLESSSSKV